MGRMNYMDQSGLFVMEDVLIDLVKQGKKVLLVKIVDQPLYMLESIDIIPDLIPRKHIFDTFDDCLDWIKEIDVTE
jgi:SulP family sulfate permease